VSFFIGDTDMIIIRTPDEFARALLMLLMAMSDLCVQT
jgi:hypothetical protein